jgi:hypothetical protein
VKYKDFYQHLFESIDLAQRRGYSVKAYHSTDEVFTEFDEKYSGGTGFYFTTNKNDILNRKIVMEVYLKLDKGMDKGDAFNKYPSGGGNPRKQIIEQMKKDGYDHWYAVNGEIAVFYPNQIKLADSITYDDSGKEISIEQRFDSNKNDIRF